MNNSVLDFALCAKAETFTTLATVERLKVKGNSFYLRITAALSAKRRA